MNGNETEHKCPHCSRCGEEKGGKPGGELIEGWPLGLASACVFLLPLIVALLGIILSRKLVFSELLGGVGGFLLGLATAVFVARLFKR